MAAPQFHQAVLRFKIPTYSCSRTHKKVEISGGIQTARISEWYQISKDYLVMITAMITKVNSRKIPIWPISDIF